MIRLSFLLCSVLIVVAVGAATNATNVTANTTNTTSNTSDVNSTNGNNSTGSNSTGNNSTGSNSTATNFTGNNSTGSNSTATNSTGNNSTGNNSTGNNSTGNNSTGSNSTATNSTGSNSTGNNSTGSNSTATNSTSNNSTGNNSTGNNSTGNNSTGNNSTGSNSTATNSTGNNSTGNNSTGNNSTGNNSTGSNSTGNNSTGNNSPDMTTTKATYTELISTTDMNSSGNNSPDMTTTKATYTELFPKDYTDILPMPSPPAEEEPRNYTLTFVGMYSADADKVSSRLKEYLWSVLRVNGSNFSDDRLTVFSKDGFTYVNVTVWSSDSLELIMGTPSGNNHMMEAAQAPGDNSTEAILQQYVQTVDYTKLYMLGHMYDVALSLLQYPTDSSTNPSYQKTLAGTPLAGMDLAMGRLVAEFGDGYGAPYPPMGSQSGPGMGMYSGGSSGSFPMPMPMSMPIASGTVCSTGLTDDTLTKLMVCNGSQARVIPYAAGGNGPLYISNVTFRDGKATEVISSPYNRKTHCTHMMDAGVLCGNHLRTSDAEGYYTESHSIACEKFDGNVEDVKMNLAKLLNVPKEQISAFILSGMLYIVFDTSSLLTSDDIYLIWQMTNDWAKMSVANVSMCKMSIKPSTTTTTNTTTTTTTTTTMIIPNTTIPPPPSTAGNTSTNDTPVVTVMTTRVRFSGKNIDKEKLKKLLEEKLGAKDDDIVIKDESDGSIVIEFSTAAYAVQARNMANNNQFQAANVDSAASEPLPDEENNGKTVIIVLAVIGGVILLIIIAIIIYKVCSGGGSSKSSGFEEENGENTEMLLAPAASGDTDTAEKPAADPPQNDEHNIPVKDEDL